MKYRQEFEGLEIIESKTFCDARGYFRETFRDILFNNLTENRYRMVQDNEAFSGPAFVLRGLHYQRAPKAQAKLLRVSQGAVYDVAVDLRKKSPSYGKWRGFELTAENALSLFIPEGFAHGYLTLVENSLVSYKVSDYYAPESEGGLLWNDPDIGIDWPLGGNIPLMSGKDMALPLLSQLGNLFE